MTGATDIKLLPLPDMMDGDAFVMSDGDEVWIDFYGENSMQDYARANVLHHTESLRGQREFQAALIEELLPYQDEAVASRTEIEALRMEIEGHRIAIQQLYDRAERLAEALLKIAVLKERESDDLSDAVGIANEALEREEDDG